ncbi:hypothetical protein HPB51_000821 [Rhipicephalus microplus]|uniref:Uncharacterized protein n=1 Tax=Rhipicephalus microplus TaxID=6941 RepID=A0A9J6EKC2_RHIMP|nr:hypothetical protein HPB51_000821 [Rhipicephalus microplus]
MPADATGKELATSAQCAVDTIETATTASCKAAAYQKPRQQLVPVPLPEFGNLELPGSFADYVGADDDFAVCSAVSLDDIIETVRPDTAGTFDKEEMDDTAEASAYVPTYADVLCYVDNIRRFACAHDEISDLLPDVAALERKLMHRGWANLQKKSQIFLKGSNKTAPPHETKFTDPCHALCWHADGPGSAPGVCPLAEEEPLVPYRYHRPPPACHHNTVIKHRACRHFKATLKGTTAET